MLTHAMHNMHPAYGVFSGPQVHMQRDPILQGIKLYDLIFDV